MRGSSLTTIVHHCSPTLPAHSGLVTTVQGCVTAAPDCVTSLACLSSH